MAIRGRLDELHAAEVLQFLTQSGRTGTLRLEEGRWSKFLAFENGRLVYAVGQHRLPPLAEILYQRGTIDSREACEELRFDDELSKALEWRRSGEPTRTPGAFPRTRLGRILIDRGRIKEADLEAVLDPKRMPESVLEEVLVHAGALSRDSIAEVRKLAASHISLHAAILKTRVLTSEQITESIACMPERMLARLLVFFGHVKNNEASYCAEQLETLRGQSRPSFRLGEYLVACGRLGQRQLERALGAQLTRRCQLGAILIEQDILTKDDIIEADREIAELRMEFSPLRVLRERLIAEFGFTTDLFAQARVLHLQSGRTLAEALVDTERIAEGDLRKLIGDILTAELSDLMLWNEGSYEFFDGFSLADALGDDGLGRIHTFSYEVSSLLLDAHYRVDELRRTSFRALGPKSILQPNSANGTHAPDKAETRLLERMDGEQPLGEVCAVLPGNLLVLCERVAGLVDAGWARPLSKGLAFKNGRECVQRGDHHQAIAFFEHASTAPGEGPDGSDLRMWVQHARMLASRNRVRRGMHSVRRALSSVKSIPVIQKPLRWFASRAFVVDLAGRVRRLRNTASTRFARTSRRLALSCQDFMIQKGLARHWWTVRNSVFSPLAMWGGRRAPKVLTSTVIIALVSVAMLMPGVTELQMPVAEEAITKPRSAHALRSPIRKLRFDTPVDVAPTITDISMFVVTRGGFLRCMPLSGSAKAVGWKVALGEYGDPLSSPTLYRDRLFVTNVRGHVHAISTDGTKLWDRNYARIEAIAPTVAVNTHQQAIGVAVVARESMIVLHPEDGRELFRLRSGNVIESRPTMAGDLVYVGSSDNHLYCCDWKKGLVLWDVEVGRDVLGLTMVDDTVVARLRGGAVMGLRANDGAKQWQLIDEASRVLDVRKVGDTSLSFEMAEGGVQIHDATTGALLKRVRPTRTDLSVRLLMTHSTYFYYSDRGDIGQVDEDGNNLWSCRQSLRRITSLTLRKNRLVVTSGEGAVWLFSLKDSDAKGVLTDD